VEEDAKEQGKDAEEAEAQRSAEKFLCFLCLLWFLTSIGENLRQSVDFFCGICLVCGLSLTGL